MASSVLVTRHVNAVNAALDVRFIEVTIRWNGIFKASHKHCLTDRRYAIKRVRTNVHGVATSAASKRISQLYAHVGPYCNFPTLELDALCSVLGEYNFSMQCNAILFIYTWCPRDMCRAYKDWFVLRLQACDQQDLVGKRLSWVVWYVTQLNNSFKSRNLNYYKISVSTFSILFQVHRLHLKVEDHLLKRPYRHFRCATSLILLFTGIERKTARYNNSQGDIPPVRRANFPSNML